MTQQALDLHDAASRGASDDWDRVLRAVGAVGAAEIASLEGELAACRSELAASRENEGRLNTELARSSESCSNLLHDNAKLNRQIAKMKGQAATMLESRPSMVPPSPCASPAKSGADTPRATPERGAGFAPRAKLGCVSPSSRNRGAAGADLGVGVGAKSPSKTVAFFESVLAGTRSDSTGSSLERLTKRLLEAEGAPLHRPSSPHPLPPSAHPLATCTGYRAEITGGSGDGGIDLIGWARYGEPIVVQCKSRGKPGAHMNDKPLQAFVGALEPTAVAKRFAPSDDFKLKKALFVTNCEALSANADAYYSEVKAGRHQELDVWRASEIVVLLQARTHDSQRT